ncbi:unnamed protein product [Cuscuta europaea]|uniref:Uncharacterized protein n=1 Tax=Cuscuta europaea TaxID=41803 RepID=A0A9P1DYS8_CUSEU|nr:unnamed protein product [Cuscuta europaea]
MLHIQFLLVRVSPNPDEGVRFVAQEAAKDERHCGGVRELEDQAAAADAELESVSRRIVSSVGAPLNADAYDEATEQAAAVAEVDGRGDPFADNGGDFGDGDGDMSVEEIDGVRTGVGTFVLNSYTHFCIYVCM